MGVLSHYLHWRQGAGTNPPEAHFARGGQAARVCGHNPARTTPGSEALSMAVALFVALAQAAHMSMYMLMWSEPPGAEPVDLCLIDLVELPRLRLSFRGET